MGRCVEKIPCRKEGCNGNNSLQVFLEEDGSHTGWCFKCGTYYKDPYEDKPDDYKPPSPLKIKSPEDIAQELAEVSELGCTDLPDRALTKKVLEFYGCKVAISEYDGVTPIATYFPYYDEQSNLKGYKVKTNEGQMFAKGTTRGVMPFGWDKVAKANKYKLFITEGEYDAMALFRVLMKSWKAEGYPAVISLPHGATSAASQLEIVHQNRHRFKEIVLVFDQDEPGRKAVADVAKLLPGVKVATLPLKDANDMLMAGRERELFEAVMFEAREKVSSQSFRSSELWHLAEAEPVMGLPWPWESMTDLTRGRRRKEVYYFGAGKLMPAINALNCWEALTYSRG